MNLHLAPARIQHDSGAVLDAAEVTMTEGEVLAVGLGLQFRFDVELQDEVALALELLEHEGLLDGIQSEVVNLLEIGALRRHDPRLDGRKLNDLRVQNRATARHLGDVEPHRPLLGRLGTEDGIDGRAGRVEASAHVTGPRPDRAVLIDIDERCGQKFANGSDGAARLDETVGLGAIQGGVEVLRPLGKGSSGQDGGREGQEERGMLHD